MGGAKCQWVDFNGYKYSVRNINSINLIVVYILPSCQECHIRLYKLDKFFKEKHSCGFIFFKTVLYTHILNTYLFH